MVHSEWLVPASFLGLSRPVTGCLVSLRVHYYNGGRQGLSCLGHYYPLGRRGEYDRQYRPGVHSRCRVGYRLVIAGDSLRTLCRWLCVLVPLSGSFASAPLAGVAYCLAYYCRRGCVGLCVGCCVYVLWGCRETLDGANPPARLPSTRAPVRCLLWRFTTIKALAKRLTPTPFVRRVKHEIGRVSLPVFPRFIPA